MQVCIDQRLIDKILTDSITSCMKNT